MDDDQKASKYLTITRDIDRMMFMLEAANRTSAPVVIPHDALVQDCPEEEIVYVQAWVKVPRAFWEGP